MTLLHTMRMALGGVVAALALAIAPAETNADPTTAGPGFEQVDGEIFGALFRVVRPDDWNGGLVLLLHGFVFPDEPLQLPPVGHEVFDPLTAELLQRGFGVAYSSYSVNGYAVREGSFDSRVARILFALHFGRPSSTYLLGFSMGTHIGQRLIETTPRRHDGLLAVCGALGGSTLQTTYFWNARILFDFYFPGALPGNVLTSDLDFETEVVPAVAGAVLSNPAAAIELAGIDQLDIRWNSFEELVEGIIFSLVGAGGGTADYQRKAHGNPIGNAATVYTGSADDAALNGGVERFIKDRRAAQYLKHFYDPRGRLHGTPVLQLHTTRDPVVPLQKHQPAFEALLAGNSDEDHYVVRAVDRFGHCALTLEEIMAAFDDLVLWDHTGIKPTP